MRISLRGNVECCFVEYQTIVSHSDTGIIKIIDQTPNIKEVF